MSPWTDSWQSEWWPLALTAWILVIGILAWLLASIGNQRPRHH
jgi:hypothetical protein